MKKLLVVIGLMLATSFSLAVRDASALLIDVSGGLSLLGAYPQIVSPPANVLDDTALNLGMQGFNEQQGVYLTSDLAVDGGYIAAGTTVNSHMIYLDEGHNTNPPTPNEHLNVTWVFDYLILGVMSDWTGSLEVASSPLLGASGTIYPSAVFDGRGLETDPYHSQPDGYTINGNQLTVSMWVIEPGDWIRVVTEPVPEPTTMLLLGTGLAGAALLRRRYR